MNECNVSTITKCMFVSTTAGTFICMFFFFFRCISFCYLKVTLKLYYIHIHLSENLKILQKKKYYIIKE